MDCRACTSPNRSSTARTNAASSLSAPGRSSAVSSTQCCAVRCMTEPHLIPTFQVRTKISRFPLSRNLRNHRIQPRFFCRWKRGYVSERRSSWILLMTRRRRSARVGVWAHPTKHRLYLFRRTGAGLAEDDASGNDDSNLGPGVNRTDQGKLAADAGSTLPHPL